MNSRLTIAIHVMGMIAWIARDHQRPATSTELAASTGTHPVYVRGILADLGAAGLVSARRGRGGGVVLARPAREITLAHVYGAVKDEAPLLGAHPGAVGAECRAAPVIERYLATLYAEAEAVLLAKLAEHDVDALSRHVVETIRAGASRSIP